MKAKYKTLIFTGHDGTRYFQDSDCDIVLSNGELVDDFQYGVIRAILQECPDYDPRQPWPRPLATF